MGNNPFITALRAILVSTIQLDASIGNFSSISGNGSQLYNLNAISSLSLQSTVRGLGSIGYISSTQLTSTVTGLINTAAPINYLSTISTVQSTITSSLIGLGTLGYISSTQLQSTVRGLGTIGYISSSQLTSTVTGLINTTAPINYLSTISTVQSTITSSIIGLGTLGYISSLSLQSTIRGLGSFGYISSTQLQSTVTGVQFNYSAITLSTGNTSVSSLSFVDLATNSTQSLYYKSTMLYFGNNIIYGALQYGPQFFTF